jgi:hypothetical protein
MQEANELATRISGGSENGNGQGTVHGVSKYARFG